MDKPSIPKGTRDFGPAQMVKREFIFSTIKTVFQKFGFQPLETPSMENLSTLTGKYGDEGDQLIFKVLNSGDFISDLSKTDREAGNSRSITPLIAEKGLRYDLTVPFARYVVMNRNDIAFPFKRYQIQPVWRADRPQKGRYREFYQCDADVVGTDSLICEAETILMIKEIFGVLHITDYTIKINHRGILSGIAEMIGAAEQENALFVAIDKLDKIGEEKVKEELSSKNIAGKSINQLFEIVNFKGNKIEFLRSRLRSSKSGEKGIADLEQILTRVHYFKDDASHIEVDISLARGLSYYTGAIFEVKINNVAIGSVCGGGRYDNLTGVFGLDGVSGTGISFGVDRLYDAMDELNLFPKESQASSKVLIAAMDESSLAYGLSLLSLLRGRGVASEVYPETVKLKKQLDYANKRMIPFVIVIGSEEVASRSVTLKNMETGEQQKLSEEQLLKHAF